MQQLETGNNVLVECTRNKRTDMRISNRVSVICNQRINSLYDCSQQVNSVNKSLGITTL